MLSLIHLGQCVVTPSSLTCNSECFAEKLVECLHKAGGVEDRRLHGPRRSLHTDRLRSPG